jgi:peptidoglycan/xylan/chitin deacetylase (PgdA/CDA1 family)
MEKIKTILRQFDRYLSEVIFNLETAKPFVISLILHKIYPQKSDVNFEHGTISEGITVDDFEKIILFFAKRNFTFITDKDLIKKEPLTNKKNVFITFDDGYYNNFLILDILKKFDAKATIYLSTNHIEEAKNYWWDVLYKERKKLNSTHALMNDELKYLYDLKWQEQEQYVISNFGEDSLFKSTDLMRPMTKQELKSMSNNPEFSFGNHTHNHLNLTQYSEQEIITSYTIANDLITQNTNSDVASIAYPFGFYNDEVSKITAAFGFKIAVTTTKGLDLDFNKKLTELNRNFISGKFSINTQCSNMLLGKSLFNRILKRG